MSNEPIFELCLFREGVANMHFPLTTGRVRLGSSPDCDLTLPDDSICEEHAVLYFTRGAWWLKPCERASGYAPVRVSGDFITEEIALSEPMEFTVGAWSLQFRTAAKMDIEDDMDDPLKGETKLLDPTERDKGQGPFVLRWTDKEGLRSEYKLKEGRLLVGKSKLCDIVIEDDYVSSRHAEICFNGADFYLKDMGSTNGTRVNGMRVKELKLEDGSEIICGKSKLVFLKRERPDRNERRWRWSISLLGQSGPFTQLARHIERVAPLAQNVFIQGETGTGKELVAAALHELSASKDGPFVAINCGAISKELMESELFGHEKGAFTGAGQRRAGAFELASGGTLFLDEIGELPIELQPKLLRVLETGRFRRVGGREELKVNVRVFSATHRDLSQFIRAGRFREDLYYRLYILPIQVPSLRERLDDIPLLVTFFVRQACVSGRDIEVSEEVFPLLRDYSWPGNIRELRNLVYRALAFCDGMVLTREHFAPFLEGVALPAPEAPEVPDAEQSTARPTVMLPPIKAKEREAIVEVLRACGGNQSETAKRLGIGRTTLYYKLKEYGIDLRRQVAL